MESQPFDYYVVLDFEATCDDKTKHEPTEIIEFPSVIIDSKTLQKVDQIQFYVKPVVHPILTAFCTQLTGIQQSSVDGGKPFLETLEEYEKWLNKHSLITNKNFAFVTCGDWDLEKMMPLQCKLSGIKVPPYMTSWVNIKKVFEKQYNVSVLGMTSMLNHLAIPLEGKHHSGIDDCNNIAKVLIKMIQDGGKVTITKTYQAPAKKIVLNYAKSGEGLFALFHQPNAKSLLDIKDAGCTHFVTLLDENENYSQFEKGCKLSLFPWIWIPIPKTPTNDENKTNKIKAGLHQLKDLLSKKATLFIHCDNGIQRSAFVGYCLLRMFGLSEEASKEEIVRIKPGSLQKGLSKENIDWAEKLIN